MEPVLYHRCQTALKYSFTFLLEPHKENLIHCAQKYPVFYCKTLE